MKALIKEATNRIIITLSELQRSTTQVKESVYGRTISQVHYKPGIYGGVARRKPLLKYSHKKSRLPFAISNVEKQKTGRRNFSDQMKRNLKFVILMQNATYDENNSDRVHHSHCKNMVVRASSCYDDTFLQRGQESWLQFMRRWIESNTGISSTTT